MVVTGVPGPSGVPVVPGDGFEGPGLIGEVRFTPPRKKPGTIKALTTTTATTTIIAILMMVRGNFFGGSGE